MGTFTLPGYPPLPRPASTGIGDRHQPEWVTGMRWNRWPASSGIRTQDVRQVYGIRHASFQCLGEHAVQPCRAVFGLSETPGPQWDRNLPADRQWQSPPIVEHRPFPGDVGALWAHSAISRVERCPMKGRSLIENADESPSADPRKRSNGAACGS